MSYMFYNVASPALAENIRSLNLSSFNTSNVTNMSYMFGRCQMLHSVVLSSFNTSNVTNMSYMFDSCWCLTSLNLSNFFTSSVNNMSGMFKECWGLTNLDLSHFDMSNVTSKSDMCRNLSFDDGVGYGHYHCTITCPLSVQTAMQSGTNLPSPDQVTFTWVRPTSK